MLVEVPKVGGVLAKSAGETLKVAGEEAVLLKDLTVVGVKRGVTDVTAMTLIVESAAEKAVGQVADSAQVGALDLTAAAVSKFIIFHSQKTKVLTVKFRKLHRWQRLTSGFLVVY